MPSDPLLSTIVALWSVLFVGLCIKFKEFGWLLFSIPEIAIPALVIVCGFFASAWLLFSGETRV